MKSINWNKVITAYKNGLTADMLQAEYGDGQGVTWTVAPCNPDALEHAGRQFSRSRVISIRHIRRAVLRDAGRIEQTVVIATELPDCRQEVRDLDTATVVIMHRFLQDDSLVALAASFTPSNLTNAV